MTNMSCFGKMRHHLLDLDIATMIVMTMTFGIEAGFENNKKVLNHFHFVMHFQSIFKQHEALEHNHFASKFVHYVL